MNYAAFVNAIIVSKGWALKMPGILRSNVFIVLFKKIPRNEGFSLTRGIIIPLLNDQITDKK
jgi:hypothetical protein